MRLNLLPKEKKFFELFEQQVEFIYQAANVLKNLVINYETCNFPKEMQELIDLEHKGDDIFHDIAVSLSKTFVTPIDREDIHGLAMYLDDVLDFIRGSAVRLQLYNIKKTTPEAVQLAEIIFQSVELIKRGVELLPKFSADICNLRKEIKDLERQGDDIHREAVAGLFNNEGLPVLYVVKWKEIYDHLEIVIDKCEDVFDVLEQVVLKHA